MDSNHRSRHERAGFSCGRRIAGPSAGSQKGLFFMRYRWFESISLQRRVHCEPDFLSMAWRQPTGFAWIEGEVALVAARPPTARLSCPPYGGPKVRIRLPPAGGFARERHGCTKMLNPARKCTSGKVSRSGLDRPARDWGFDRSYASATARRTPTVNAASCIRSHPE
jgi:hypothetical protein